MLSVNPPSLMNPRTPVREIRQAHGPRSVGVRVARVRDATRAAVSRVGGRLNPGFVSVLAGGRAAVVALVGTAAPPSSPAMRIHELFCSPECEERADARTLKTFIPVPYDCPFCGARIRRPPDRSPRPGRIIACADCADTTAAAISVMRTCAFCGREW